MMAWREMTMKVYFLKQRIYHEKLKSFLVIDSNINTPISNISPLNSHGIELWNRLQPTNITKGTSNWRLDRKWGSFSLAWHNASAWRLLHSLDRSWKACSVVCTCTWKGVINFFPNGVVNLWKQISCDFFSHAQIHVCSKTILHIDEKKNRNATIYIHVVFILCWRLSYICTHCWEENINPIFPTMNFRIRNGTCQKKKKRIYITAFNLINHYFSIIPITFEKKKCSDFCQIQDMPWYICLKISWSNYKKASTVSYYIY